MGGSVCVHGERSPGRSLVARHSVQCVEYLELFSSSGEGLFYVSIQFKNRLTRRVRD